MTVWTRGVVLSVLLSVSAQLQAVLNIQITEGMDGAIPIAILPFSGEPLSDDITDMHAVIRSDLLRSGYLRPLASSEYPSDLGAEATDLVQWQHLSVEAVLAGEIQASETAGHYDVSVRLWDVFQTQTGHGRLKDGELILPQSEDIQALWHYRFTAVAPKDFRTLAHRISDAVYESITEAPGVFSTKVAYVQIDRESEDNLPYRMVVADVDGHNPITVFRSQEPIMSPAWSPDGERLAFVSFETHRAEIYELDVYTGQRQRRARYPRINGAPAFSPDEQHMVIVLSKDGSPKLYEIDRETSQMKQLTFGYSIDTEPHYAPDGQSIYFTSNRGGKPQIYRLNRRDGEIERITYAGNYNARPSVTPDGKTLVMVHRNDDGVFRIAKQDLKTGRVTPLTTGAVDCESPTISPNGQRVLYSTRQDGQTILASVSMDGRLHWALPENDGQVQEPAWAPYVR